MSKKYKKAILDAILTILMIAAMFIQYTGTFLHEIIGFAFFVTVVAHLVLSASWIKSGAAAIGKRKASSRTVLLMIIGGVLAVAMVVLAVSSIAISTILEGAGFSWPFGDYGTWTAVHGAISYGLCGIVAIHLATHWSFVASVLKLAYSPSNRRMIGAGVYTGALLSAGALGMFAVSEFSLPEVTAQVQTVSVAVEENETGNDGAQTGSDTKTVPQSSIKPSRKSKTTVLSGVQSQSEEQNGSSVQQGEDSEGEEVPLPTGFCTLCHKGCALSSPRCERPYDAGLTTVHASQAF